MFKWIKSIHRTNPRVIWTCICEDMVLFPKIHPLKKILPLSQQVLSKTGFLWKFRQNFGPKSLQKVSNTVIGYKKGSNVKFLSENENMFSQLSNAPSNVALRLLDQKLHRILSQDSCLKMSKISHLAYFCLMHCKYAYFAYVLESLTDFSVWHMPA